MSSTPDRPRGARYWAREWGVHHNTARKLLRHLHEQYGSRVVWRAGPQRALVATSASLQVVRVLRAERNLILILPDHHRAQQPPAAHVRSPLDEEAVTQEQHAQALAEVWRALSALGVRRP